MEDDNRIQKFRNLMQRRIPTKTISYLDSGFESVLFTDNELIYKILDKWNPEWSSLLEQLIGRFQGCKRLVDLKKFYYYEDVHILEYEYFESAPYNGGLEEEMIEFLIECKERGIVCWDVKPKNFRISDDGLKFVDYGWDIKPFNYKDFLFMVQRAFLTLKYHDKKDLKSLARKTLKQWNISELTGFIEFFNKVYGITLEQRNSLVVENPITLFDENNLIDKIRKMIRNDNRNADIRILEYRAPRIESIFNEKPTISFNTIDDLSKLDFKRKFHFIVANSPKNDSDYITIHLKKFRKLVYDDGQLIIIINNPFFYNEKELYFVENLRRTLLYSGFLFDSIEESPHQVDIDGGFYSDYMIIKAHSTTFLDCRVSLIIKTCYQDGYTIERQIRHIVDQCEYPERFFEKIVVIDPKEDDFLRQYSIPDKEKLYTTLSKLREEEVISDYYTAPNDPKDIENINRRWFRVSTKESHDVRNIPVTPQLFAFEKARGEFVLQVDSDVIIGRRDIRHNYLSDMIDALKKNPHALSVSFNIAHPENSEFKEYLSPQLGEYVPEVRFCLLHRDRFLNSRPFPNELINNKLKLSWYRSVHQLQRDKGLVSLRSGDPRSFYIHPPNTRKTDVGEWFSIVDRVESGYIPKIQFENVDLIGSDKDWAVPKRNEQFIFIICGRNIPPRKFFRCWQSVINQEKENWGAIIVDDASTTSISEYINIQINPFREKVTFLRNHKRLGVLQNIYWAVKLYCTNPFSIIIILDADDMLLSQNVLNVLDQHYLTGANVTVGTMLRMDKGIMNYIPNFTNPRNKRGGDVWMHLRTFRKYLFDNINKQDLKMNGEWVDKFAELTYMVPIAEMAHNPVHINWPVYLYEPTQKRDKEHYIRNQKTKDFVNSLIKYEKFSLPKDIRFRPPGELLKLLKSCNIIFIRHAETIEVKQTAQDERKDDSLPLTTSGKDNCILWGASLPIKVDLIFTSKTRRTLQTAKFIRDGNNSNCKIITIPELRGVKKQDIEKWKELVQKNGYRESIRKWIKSDISREIITPYPEYMERLLANIREKLDDSKNTLIITHDHMIRNLAYYLFKELKFKIRYLNGFILNDSKL